MSKPIRLPMPAVCILLALLTAAGAARSKAAGTAILTPGEKSWAEDLAAREVRRYVFLRTSKLLPLIQETDLDHSREELILVSRKDRGILAGLPEVAAAAGTLEPQEYLLRTVDRKATTTREARWRRSTVLLVIGGDDAGTLYGAYRLAEILGARFYLHDDVLPDDPMKWRMPRVQERSKPLFPLRGIQPFHDFPEGPDWWNRDDYLAILGQLPKLRMNFFGLHTYPEDRPAAEPTVWIGPESEIGSRGQVSASYPASYQNTSRDKWGYAPRKTGTFAFGASALFESDDFGPDVMAGHIPEPRTPEACNEVFNRTAALLHDAFAFARQVGVKPCVGTETPLVLPKSLQARLKAAGKDPADLKTVEAVYAGIFRRASQAYPLDFFWFWTPEGWTWSGTKNEEVRAATNDLLAAIAAYRTVQPPFALATCGWVLGPQQDRAMFDKFLPKEVAVSCINREVGKTPVEPGFADVQGRSKWAIPWMEDDPALTSPQLWVGRMRRDAADALRYGCDGLMGIHWRTRVLAPNVAALAHAAWNQQPWIQTYEPAPPPSRAPRSSGPTGGASAVFPNNPIAGTDDPIPYQTVRYNLSAYHLPATNGSCQVTLKFCEPHYAEAGKRVFDVKLQGLTVITNLDIFARVGRNKALDFTFSEVVVTNGWIDIDFVPQVEFPSIAAIEVQAAAFAIKINCGGPAHEDYAADAPATEPPKQVFAGTLDFYQDWALHEFGPEIASAAATIFSRVDCKLPVPSVWTDGPGGIQPDSRPWEQVKQDYSFVDDFSALLPQVRGQGNLDRFHYWLNTLKYFRTIGELNCAWGEFNRAMETARGEKVPRAAAELAKKLAVPARVKLLDLVGQLYQYMLATVSTPGELGTVANWEQHNLPVLLTKPGEELAKLLGAPLPAQLLPDHHYRGPTRVIVLSKRTALESGESLKLKAIILSEKPPRTAQLYYRKLGTGNFSRMPLQHLARSVYTIQVPWTGHSDLEYYLKVEPDSGRPVFYPPTAPKLNRTVVVYGRF